MLNIKKEEKIKTVDDQGPNNIGNVETYCSLTQAEYDELSETEKNNGIVYYITDSDTHLTTASTIYYDNSNSHISSTSVQGALDTLDTMLGAIGDGELTELETIIDNAQIALDNVQPIIPTSSGTTGQVLTKTSTGADWGDINALPAGGTVGQVLTKVSSSIGDATWQTPSGGAVDAVNGISPDNNKNVQIDVELTQAEYNALPATKNSDNVNYYITDGITSEVAADLEAEDISYDNTSSDLSAVNVQDALDEIKESLIDMQVLVGFTTMQITSTTVVNSQTEVTITRTFPTIVGADKYLVYLLSSNGFIVKDFVGYYSAPNTSQTIKLMNISSTAASPDVMVGVLGFKIL